MKVERTDMGAATVLRLQGDIDESGVDDLRTALYECINDGRTKLVMNLSGIASRADIPWRMLPLSEVLSLSNKARQRKDPRG